MGEPLIGLPGWCHVLSRQELCGVGFLHRGV